MDSVQKRASHPQRVEAAQPAAEQRANAAQEVLQPPVPHRWRAADGTKPASERAVAPRTSIVRRQVHITWASRQVGLWLSPAQARHCGKMLLLEKLLVMLKAEGHRVLLFSQMVRMLTLFEELMKQRSWDYQRLDGNTPQQARQVAIDHFNAPGSKDFAFLLSTRAGGLGYVGTDHVQCAPPLLGDELLTGATCGVGFLQHQLGNGGHCYHL